MVETKYNRQAGLVFNGTSFVLVESLNAGDSDLEGLAELTNQKIKDLGDSEDVAELKSQLTAGLAVITPPADSSEE